jgi:hypothetical protein
VSSQEPLRFQEGEVQACPTLQDHARRFLRDGVVKLEGVIDPQLLRECADHLAGKGGFEAFGSDAHWTNPDRFYAALPIDGPLARSEIVANSAISALARATLGEDCVLESFGIIVSLPGAAAQHTHFDGILFPGSPCNRIIPPFALTVAIPLVAVDKTNGSTGFFLGSHHHERHEGEPDFVPDVALGSALAWDYRVRHRGEANLSDRARPVLFAVYCRRWWQDMTNYKRATLKKLLLSPSAAVALLPEYESLLMRAEPREANTEAALA